MKQQNQRTGRRPSVIWPALVLIAVPTLFLVRSTTDDDGGGTTVLQVAVIAALGAVAMFLLMQLARMLAGDDPEAAVLAEHLAADPDQQELLSRWMSRARRARNIGGIAGLLVWIFGTQMRGDLLLFGVGGIALGAMAAELHHVRPSRRRRTATLDVRSIDNYMLDRDRRRMIGIAAIAVGLAIVGVLVDDGGVALLCGVLALAGMAAAHLVQRRVASRPRPAVPERLRRADDLARELAIGRGLARPACYFALALIARGTFSLEPDLGSGMVALGAAAWLYALYLWWNNRRLGLDFVVERPQPLLA